MPLLSVIMSVYNDENTLNEAIESILGQSFKDFELIIMNDGSSDDSLKIMQTHMNKDDRVVIIDQENTGLTKALNVGLTKAAGKYIARMDADDVSKPERFAKQIAFLQAHPKVAICGSQADLIDINGNIVGKKQLPTESADIKGALLFNNQCVHSSLIIRADVLKELGPYSEHFRTSQDYELLLRVAAKHDIVNLDEPLVQWRVREGSISWSSKQQEWDALRARWWAVSKYGYPKLKGLFHIVIRFGWYALPQKLKMRRYV